MLISQLQRWKLCNQTDWNAPKIVGSFSLVSAGSQQQTELRRHFLVQKTSSGNKQASQPITCMFIVRFCAQRTFVSKRRMLERAMIYYSATPTYMFCQRLIIAFVRILQSHLHLYFSAMQFNNTLAFHLATFSIGLQD